MNTEEERDEVMADARDQKGKYCQGMRVSKKTYNQTGDSVIN